MRSRWTGWMVLAAVAVGGCTAEQPPDDIPPIGGTDGGGPPGDDDDDFVPQIGPMRLTITPGLDYPMRLRKTNTVDDLCEVTPAQDPAGFQSIDCTLDINELDLYGHGIDWDLQVPQGACDYVIYYHYQYEAWQVGIGPTEVSYEIVPGVGYINEVNSINGVPYCPYDHYWRVRDAPSCCLGPFVRTVTQNGVVTVTKEFWQGNPSNCYSGAAFIDPDASFGPDGFPRAKIVYLNGASYQKTFHWEPLSTMFLSNIPLANYFNPQDHDGDLPAGLRGEWAIPQYTVLCTDRAEEYLAEIRLTVREYNEEPQFDVDGDPDTVGFEPVTGDEIDDRADWAVGTPGSDVYIEDYE